MLINDEQIRSNQLQMRSFNDLIQTYKLFRNKLKIFEYNGFKFEL